VGPFDDAKDANELLLAHLGKEAARLAWAAPGVPPELDQLVARLLAKDPAQRPTSARQVATALREIASRATTVSTSAPTPSAQHADATEGSISAVPTNPLPLADEAPTVVPEGGYTQVAPTDPVPSLIHSQSTRADLVGSATTQCETPRVGTPSAAAVTPARRSSPPRSSSPMISVGPASRSAELDSTVAANPAGGSDTLHSPAQFPGAPASAAPSRHDRTLRIDELFPFPADGGAETRTSVPLGAPGGETPPPVESSAPLPPKPRGGMPAWIPLALTALVIATLVAIGTWVLIGSPASVPAAAAPAPEPVGSEPSAVAELEPPTGREPTIEPAAEAEPNRAVSAMSSAAPRTGGPAQKPVAAATPAKSRTPVPAPPPPEHVKPTPPKKPPESAPSKSGLVLPGSGL
jgi:hypothetical protein